MHVCLMDVRFTPDNILNKTFDHACDCSQVMLECITQQMHLYFSVIVFYMSDSIQGCFTKSSIRAKQKGDAFLIEQMRST